MTGKECSGYKKETENSGYPHRERIPAVFQKEIRGTVIGQKSFSYTRLGTARG